MNYCVTLQLLHLGSLREAADKWLSDSVVIRCNALEIVHSDATNSTGAVLSDKSIVTNNTKSNSNNSKIGNENCDNEMNDSSTVERPDIAVNGEEEVEEENDTEIALESSHTHRGNTTLTISPTIEQTVHVCAAHKKPRLLFRYLSTIRDREKTEKTRHPAAILIFATKIKSVKFVVDFLRRQNIQVEMLHGQLPQTQREKALADFKAVRG